MLFVSGSRFKILIPSPRRTWPVFTTRHSHPRRPRSSSCNPCRISSIREQGSQGIVTSSNASPMRSRRPGCISFMSSPRVVMFSFTRPGSTPSNSRVPASIMETWRLLPGRPWMHPRNPLSATASASSTSSIGKRWTRQIKRCSTSPTRRSRYRSVCRYSDVLAILRARK